MLASWLLVVAIRDYWQGQLGKRSLEVGIGEAVPESLSWLGCSVALEPIRGESRGAFGKERIVALLSLPCGTRTLPSSVSCRDSAVQRRQPRTEAVLSRVVMLICDAAAGPWARCARGRPGRSGCSRRDEMQLF